MTSYTFLKVTALLLVLLAVATAAFHRTQWKAVTQLLLCMVLFPVNSALYAGTYLFVGIILFLNHQDHRRMDWVVLVLMVLILNPVQYTLASGLSLTIAIANVAAYILLILLSTQSSKVAWNWFVERSTQKSDAVATERLQSQVVGG